MVENRQRYLICILFTTDPKCLRDKRCLPLLEVYNKAAWKQQVFVSRVSSIDICIPNPASGLMFGNDNKSVDLTKKFPWNVCILNPK